MAHIQFRKNPDGLTTTLVVNGLDLSMESYAGSVELAATGDSEYDEIGLRFLLAIERLDLDEDMDVEVAGNLDALNERIRAMQEREF